MRLNDESVIEGGHLTQEERIALQAEEIKQLWQENEQLKAKLDDWKYEAQWHMDEVVIREKQIEQLRAQVAKMREALELCSWYGSEGLCIDEKLARKIMKALRPDSGTDYHNPADVEVLRKVRTAINNILYTVDYYIAESEIVPNEMHKRHINEAKEALAEIDKAIRGGQE